MNHSRQSPLAMYSDSEVATALTLLNDSSNELAKRCLAASTSPAVKGLSARPSTCASSTFSASAGLPSLGGTARNRARPGSRNESLPAALATASLASTSALCRRPLGVWPMMSASTSRAALSGWVAAGVW